MSLVQQSEVGVALSSNWGTLQQPVAIKCQSEGYSAKHGTVNTFVNGKLKLSTVNCQPGRMFLVASKLVRFYFEEKLSMTSLVALMLEQNAPQESRLTQWVFTKAHQAPHGKENASCGWNRTWVPCGMKPASIQLHHSDSG